jgi:hypothetical protein
MRLKMDAQQLAGAELRYQRCQRSPFAVLLDECLSPKDSRERPPRIFVKRSPKSSNCAKHYEPPEATKPSPQGSLICPGVPSSVSARSTEFPEKYHYPRLVALFQN